MERLKLTGVVLRTVDYGEADRVVTLLTEERGKVSGFARGARRSRKRFGGALEPFTLLRVEARERRSGDLLVMDTVDVTRAFAGIRSELARIACAGYACDLARALVREGEPHPDLLSMVLEYLGTLDAAPARPATLRAYELAVLGAAGVMPRLSGCARCGADVSAMADVAFDPSDGGVLCGSCERGTLRSGPRLSSDAVVALARLQAGGLAGAAPEAMAPSIAVEAREALTRFIEHHLGYRPASRRFLDQVGPLLGA